MIGTITYQGLKKGIEYNGSFYPLHPDSAKLSQGKVGLLVHFKLWGGMSPLGKQAKIYERTPTYGKRKVKPL